MVHRTERPAASVLIWGWAPDQAPSRRASRANPVAMRRRAGWSINGRPATSGLGARELGARHAQHRRSPSPSLRRTASRAPCVSTLSHPSANRSAARCWVTYPDRRAEIGDLHLSTMLLAPVPTGERCPAPELALPQRPLSGSSAGLRMLAPSGFSEQRNDCRGERLRHARNWEAGPRRPPRPWQASGTEATAPRPAVVARSVRSTAAPSEWSVDAVAGAAAGSAATANATIAIVFLRLRIVIGYSSSSRTRVAGASRDRHALVSGSRVDQDHLVLVGGGRDAGVELRVDHRQSTAKAGRRGRHLEQVAGDDILDHSGGEVRA
jgi:hypothetical protein